MTVDTKQLAENALFLLQQDPSRYRSFGPYWYTIKALLKRYYTRDNLHLLGDYTDPEVVAAQPVHGSMDEVLLAACDWYRNHQAFGLGRAQFETDDGEVVHLLDQDAGGL